MYIKSVFPLLIIILKSIKIVFNWNTFLNIYLMVIVKTIHLNVETNLKYTVTIKIYRIII